jgi:signal peptidase II
MRTLYWTSFWVFLLDQASKWIVVHYLNLITLQRIEVLSPFITLQMAWNKGVNFGLFANYDMRWVLIGIAIVISAAVLFWLTRSKTVGKWHYVAGGFLIGGALGNIVDRLLYGAVADFLNMSCCGINNPYVFNVADIAIFAGAVGLAFLPDAGPKPRKKKAT